MKVMSSPGKRRFWFPLVIVAVAAFAASTRAAETGEFNLAGAFVEGCNCAIPCTCETKGLKQGCNGIQAFAFTGGRYHGVGLSGARMVVAGAPGNWMRVYVDARNVRQQKAVGDLATAIYRKMGNIESVQKAGISISGKQGRYKVSVNQGQIAMLSTQPVEAANGEGPARFDKTQNPFSPAFYQGKTLKGSFNDGGRSFKLEGGNSFFNDQVQNQGTL